MTAYPTMGAPRFLGQDVGQDVDPVFGRRLAGILLARIAGEGGMHCSANAIGS